MGTNDSRGCDLFLFSLAGGIWGGVALAFGLPSALTAAAVGLALVPLAGLRWPLAPIEAADRRAAEHWPPAPAGVPATSGPVLVSVDYRVASRDAPRFIARMQELRRVRRRDGATAWSLDRDLADPEHFVEHFHVRTWGEHLRQHERVTRADLAVEREIRELGANAGQPPVTHLVEVERAETTHGRLLIRKFWSGRAVGFGSARG
jgi:Transmembrane secretion effector